MKSKYGKWLGIVVGVVLSVALLIAGLQIFIYDYIIDVYYETTDIADYGTYIGNYDNKTPTEFITSFFPETIESYFEDIRYVYRAEEGDTYAYEAYLEFTIRDESLFLKHVNGLSVHGETKAFPYDTNYQEYIVSDILDLHSQHENGNQGGKYYSIQKAKIGKILINYENNSIIYVAIGVYAGGGANTNYLHEYFERFQIDPLEYAYERGDSLE